LRAEDYLTLLDAQGRALVDAVRQRTAGDGIPFCAAWTLRDLVTHTAQIYRWVDLIVREVRNARPGSEEGAILADPDPDDPAGTVERLALAHRTLVDTLRGTPADVDCWTIWPAHPARVFWLRRMLHETVVHHVDAQNAGQPSVATGADLDPVISVDGIDEMVCGFAQRYSPRLRTGSPVTLSLRCSVTGLRWWARIGPDAPAFGRGTAPVGVDTEVTGHPGELLLLLWNRRLPAGLDVRGESGALDVWARQAHL
jgi:uncharacterized protein (TIGR03083 family)